jgi:prefoldin subunit 5
VWPPPVLVLPVELWDELDVVGRRAVIHHELAHLKRRDHWVCWAELIAMAIYWWNPLVWWVRRRIREEADLCCDAWVTTLFPHGRRAYAQALLNTRRFISDSSSARPDVGLGAISSGARHFARRLTMVMTHRPTPSRTLPGIFLAATIAAAGFLAAPLVACPPEDEKEQAAKEVAAKEKARNKVAVAGQPVAPVPSAAPRAAQAPRTPKPPKAPRATLAPQTTTPAPAAAVTVPATPAPPDQWSAGAPEAAARAYVDESRARERAAAAPRYPTPRGGVSAPQGGADLKQMQQRIDQLDRRLDEMNRRLDQVLRRLEMRGEADPVEMNQAITTTGSFNPLFATIASTGDGDDQRAIVILLGPGDKVEAFKVRQGNMGALTSLLSESGDPLSAKVYAHAEAERALVARKLDLDRFQEQISRAHVDARDQALAAERAVLAQNHAALAELHQHVDQHRQAADRLREKAEQLAERSESMQERIAELMERAEQTEGAERKASLKQVEVLRAQIEALQNAAEKLQEQAEELAEHAGDLSDEAMEMIDESAEETAEEPDENPSAEPMVIAPLMPEPPVKPTPAVRPN